jgi:hypothetical protein
VLLCLLSALNAIGLVLNISSPLRAAIGGMTYQQLIHDADFTRAVKAIVQECNVNIDLAKLTCRATPD